MSESNTIKLMLWNANGIIKHKNELQIILDRDNIDVCLITETHLTKNAFIKFKNYAIYHTIHPSNTPRGEVLYWLETN